MNNQCQNAFRNYMYIILSTYHKHWSDWPATTTWCQSLWMGFISAWLTFILAPTQLLCHLTQVRNNSIYIWKLLNDKKITWQNGRINPTVCQLWSGNNNNISSFGIISYFLFCYKELSELFRTIIEDTGCWLYDSRNKSLVSFKFLSTLLC